MKNSGLWFFGFIVLFSSSIAFADSSPDVVEMLESMKKQMNQMQQTIDAQNAKIQALEAKVGASSNVPSAQIATTESATPTTDADFQKSLKNNIGEVIPWIKGIKSSGDLRLRMENFHYYDKSLDSGATDRSRNRFRLRLRWGLEKDFGDDWKLGFRLATGSTTDQVSTNQTLGNNGYFNFKSINIDRAYAQVSPSVFKDKGALKNVAIGAGKFENPFGRYSTTIVWDSDVTPEGLYEKANFELVSTEENKLNLTTNLGQFILSENTGESTDAQLYGYQGALTLSTYAFKSKEPVDLTLAVSYYDYVNWFRTYNNNGNLTTATTGTTNTSYLRTNTTALDDPRILDIYPEIVFYANRIPVTLWANYVENVGEIDATRLALDPIHGQDTAWGLGFKYGKTKKRGDWEASYGYYEIGTNAVVAAFNDADFGGPSQNGFTNRKGHKLGFGYQITDSITFNWTGYFVKPLTASNLVASSADESVFRSQADINFKF